MSGRVVSLVKGKKPFVISRGRRLKLSPQLEEVALRWFSDGEAHVAFLDYALPPVKIKEDGSFDVVIYFADDGKTINGMTPSRSHTIEWPHMI